MKTKIYFLTLIMLIPILTIGQITEPEFTGVQKNARTSDDIVHDPLIAYLTQNFRCPDGSNKCIPEGTSVVQFVVTPEGELTNIEVVNSLCCLVDDELIRALETTNGMWNPAKDDGIPVSKVKEVSLMFVTNQRGDNPKDYFENNAISYFNKGNKYFLDKSNPKKAIKFYNQSIKYRPGEAASLLLRGLCRYELGDEEGACKDWNRINVLGKANVDEYLDNICEMKGKTAMLEILDK